MRNVQCDSFNASPRRHIFQTTSCHPPWQGPQYGGWSKYGECGKPLQQGTSGYPEHEPNFQAHGVHRLPSLQAISNNID